MGNGQGGRMGEERRTRRASVELDGERWVADEFLDAEWWDQAYGRLRW